jgi:hypothetical protein
MGKNEATKSHQVKLKSLKVEVQRRKRGTPRTQRKSRAQRISFSCSAQFWLKGKNYIRKLTVTPSCGIAVLEEVNTTKKILQKTVHVAASAKLHFFKLCVTLTAAGRQVCVSFMRD